MSSVRPSRNKGAAPLSRLPETHLVSELVGRPTAATESNLWRHGGGVRPDETPSQCELEWEIEITIVSPKKEPNKGDLG